MFMVPPLHDHLWEPIFDKLAPLTTNKPWISQISNYFANFERPFTPQTWLRSGSNFAKTRFRRFPTFHFSTPKTEIFSNCLQTLKIRLPPEDGSVWPETLGKRVSDDPRHFIFRRRKKKIDKNFRLKFFCCNPPPKIGKLPVLEELWIFGRHQQMRLENSLPELSVSAFYDPWRRGKKGGFCFFRDFWPKRTCTLFRRYSTIFHDIQTIFEDIQTIFDDIQTIFRRYSTIFHDIQALFQRYWVLKKSFAV